MPYIFYGLIQIFKKAKAISEITGKNNNTTVIFYCVISYCPTLYANSNDIVELRLKCLNWNQHKALYCPSLTRMNLSLQGCVAVVNPDHRICALSCCVTGLKWVLELSATCYLSNVHLPHKTPGGCLSKAIGPSTPPWARGKIIWPGDKHRAKVAAETLLSDLRCLTCRAKGKNQVVGSDDIWSIETLSLLYIFVCVPIFE